MNITRYSTHSLTAAGLALLALSPRPALADQICVPLPFDRIGFASSVDQSLSGIKGYSVAISKDGQIVANVNGGEAVDGEDTPFPIPWTGSTPGMLGSTTKMITTVALLQAFENDPGATVDEWLDRYIVDFFPQPWRDRVLDPASPDPVNDVEHVRFRDILQHRSGLPNFQLFITNGINIANLGNRDYSNGNMSVIPYMLPYIADPAYGAEIDLAVAGAPAVQDGPIADYTLTFFEEYLQDSMFDLVDISVHPEIPLPYGEWSERFEPSCNHKQTYAVADYFTDEDWGTTDDIPVIGDIDGDGRDDLSVWRPSSARWYTRTVEGFTLTSGLVYGDSAQGDIPLIGDVNGDGHDDYVIWREDTAQWYTRSAGGPVLVNGLPYGAGGDIPFVGQLGGNPGEDLAVWRPSTQRWYASQRDGTELFSAVPFGTSGDVPHLGDVTGDGIAELVMWRPSTGEWFARDITTGVNVFSGLHWGLPSDQSLLGDADGDGRKEPMIFRPSTGEWYARSSDSSDEYFREVYFGQSKVSGAGPIIPLVADFAGDFKDKLTLFRPSNGLWSAAGRRYALGYQSAIDIGPGAPAPFIDEPPGCAGQGGTWMSSIEFAAWAAALAQGEFISLGLLDSMFDPTSVDTRGERLGWAIVDFAPPFISANYGVNYLPWHDGAERDFRTALIELPDGYYGVAISNDAVSGATILKDAIVDAWIEAVDLDCED